MSSYEPVQSREDLGGFTIDDDDDEDVLYGQDPHHHGSTEEGREHDTTSNVSSEQQERQDSNERILPMEVDGYSDTASEGFTSAVTLFSWKDPWFPNICVLCILVVPPLKGGGTMDPTFLNELDGFSTMAPTRCDAR